MHPSPAFAWTDEAAMRAFVAEVAFATIAVAAESGVAVAHAPLAPAADGGFRFHLARTNRIVPHLDGGAVTASVVGEHFYVSPDWYGTPDQVPTWNYRLVEVSGTARRLYPAETLDQLDRLGAVHEAALAPKPAWTRDKLTDPRHRALLAGLVGFAIDRPVLRGTAKFGQGKRADEAAGVAAALRALGREGAARAMEQA